MMTPHLTNTVPPSHLFGRKEFFWRSILRGHVIMRAYASHLFRIYLGSLQSGKQHFDVRLNVGLYNSVFNILN